jgi:hypothetical protein
MRAAVHLGGGATSEVLTVSGARGDPFVILTVRDHEVILSRSEARRVSDALRAVALLAHEALFQLPSSVGGSRLSVEPNGDVTGFTRLATGLR